MTRLRVMWSEGYESDGEGYKSWSQEGELIAYSNGIALIRKDNGYLEEVRVSRLSTSEVIE